MKSTTGSSSSVGNARPATTTDSILVALLGEVALRRTPGSPLVPVPGARSRLLVAALAAHPGRSRSAQALIDDVWGADPPRSPMNALHTQVSRLRSALPEGALEIGPAGYRLVLAPEQVDLTLAQDLEKRARQAFTDHDDATCLQLLAAARALWRGEPGADLPPGSVAEELTALAAARHAALDLLELSAREAAGDLPGAIDLARGIVAAAPLDESAHAALMRLLAGAGRTSEALDVFATLRTRLVEELGADPGPTLIALNSAILRGEPLPATAARNSNPRVEQDNSIDGAVDMDGRSGNSPQWGQRRAGQMLAAAQHFGDKRGAGPEPAAAIGLRVAPNALLGRDADLDALERLVRNSRVTTVLGPGGTGKTRVANELGARVAHEKSVVLIELASLRADPGGIAETRAEIEATIGATLGVGDVGRESSVLRPARGRDFRQRVREALSVRPMLLILDNCEHLIEPVAEVVADLVGLTEQLTILTTSRAPLEITAETVYPLPPLTIDAAGSPATELFAARARAVRPSVRLDPDVVARLCSTLDGLPLAIELAAARVRTMSVEEIESRLDHRFALLRTGDRSSPQRHRTLHAVIEWSWNLLDEQQRVALRRLCRFPAGFTLAAAEAVLVGPEILDAATAVDGLVTQSLLTVLPDDDTGGVRYRMLETVREFGEEQLTRTGEADLVMTRMSQWAKDFVITEMHRYQSPEQIAAVLSVGAEAENLAAVLRYALDRNDAEIVHVVYPALAGLWAMRGAHAELVGWTRRIVAVPPRLDCTDRDEADLQMVGQLLLGMHMLFADSPLREVATVRARVRRLLHSTPLSPVSSFLGGLVAEARTTVQFARKLSAGTRSEDTEVRVAALILRANVRENNGEVWGSIRDGEAALRTGIEQDVWANSMVCQHLGSMHGQSARYAESVSYYRRCAALLQELRAWDEIVETRSFLAVSLAGLGEIDAARRELEAALGHLGAGLPIDGPVPQPNQRLAAVAAGMAEIELVEGDIDTALRRYRLALPLLNWPQSVSIPGPGDLMLGAAVIDAYTLHGRAGEMSQIAAELIELGIQKLSQFRDLPQLGAISCAIGTHLLATGGDPDLGLELLALAPKVFGRQDYPVMQWRRHLELHRRTYGDDRVTAARDAVGRLSRRASAERILELLRVLGNAG